MGPRKRLDSQVQNMSFEFNDSMKILLEKWQTVADSTREIHTHFHMRFILIRSKCSHTRSCHQSPNVNNTAIKKDPCSTYDIVFLFSLGRQLISFLHKVYKLIQACWELIQGFFSLLSRVFLCYCNVRYNSFSMCSKPTQSFSYMYAIQLDSWVLIW